MFPSKDGRYCKIFQTRHTGRSYTINKPPLPLKYCCMKPCFEYNRKQRRVSLKFKKELVLVLPIKESIRYRHMLTLYLSNDEIVLGSYTKRISLSIPLAVVVLKEWEDSKDKERFLVFWEASLVIVIVFE